jgi:hypothetical protein
MAWLHGLAAKVRDIVVDASCSSSLTRVPLRHCNTCHHTYHHTTPDHKVLAKTRKWDFGLSLTFPGLNLYLHKPGGTHDAIPILVSH